MNTANKSNLISALETLQARAVREISFCARNPEKDMQDKALILYDTINVLNELANSGLVINESTKCRLEMITNALTMHNHNK